MPVSTTVGTLGNTAGRFDPPVASALSSQVRTRGSWPTGIRQSSLPPYCFAETPAAAEYVLEHLSFDRLLQDGNLSKPAVDAFGTISGHKNKWHAARQHRVGDRV